MAQYQGWRGVWACKHEQYRACPSCEKETMEVTQRMAAIGNPRVLSQDDYEYVMQIGRYATSR